MKKVFANIIQVSSFEESKVVIENSCCEEIQPQHKYKQAIDDPPAATIYTAYAVTPDTYKLNSYISPTIRLSDIT